MNKQGPGKIEYMDKDWNPITGCKHGCHYCYMRRMVKRFGYSMEPAFHSKRLREPYALRSPARIGVSFTGDMWGEWVPKEWISKVLKVCAVERRHRFLFLTKNPRRYGEFDIPPNCWCGTSTTGEMHDIKRLTDFYDCAPQGRRFISLEPYIGDGNVIDGLNTRAVQWLIVGGLTGKGAIRPSEYQMQQVLLLRVIGMPLFIKSNTGYPEVVQEYPEGLRI